MEVIVALVFGVAYLTVTSVQTDVTVELPRVEPAPAQSEHQISISLGASGEIYLNSDDVTRAELAQHLSEIEESDRRSTRVLIRVHPDQSYATVMELMTMISDAGFNDIGLVTREDETTSEGSMIPSEQ